MNLLNEISLLFQYKSDIDILKHTKTEQKMKNIYLILLLLIMVGCKEVKEPKIADSYELEIKYNGTVLARHLVFGSKDKVIVGLRGYKGERLTFDKHKTKVKFNILDGKKPSVYKFFIISRKRFQEKLFGLLEVNATKTPTYTFTEYVDLKKDKEIYNSIRDKKYKLGNDWLRVWDSCEGSVALKKDGSLWKFGNIGGCDYGSIMFEDKSVTRNIYLKPQKIADGFKDASISTGGCRLYALKSNGTLWRIQELENNLTVTKVDNSNNWKSVGLNIPIHDGFDFDIGLKDDGSLWALYSYSGKIEPLAKGEKWNRVIVFGGYSIIGEKKDGTLWKIEMESIKPLVKKDFDSEKSYFAILQRFKKIPLYRVEGDNHVDAFNGVDVKNGGISKLYPYIKVETISLYNRMKRVVYPASK